MDYEKMYKAVLKTATQWIEDGCSDKEKICLESVFPELRESEDERIAEELIKALRGVSTGLHQYAIFLTEEEKQRWLSWLEKQKETANSFTDGIIEVRSFRRGLEEGRRLEKQKEQKPRWEINNPHTTKWTKEMIDEKFEELVEEYHKQKPVVTHGETYHVDTLGTQQVIAGKMPQKPAEWSEEDEEMLNSCICSIEESKENRYAYKETDGDTSYDHEIAWLKSLRPQPKDEIYKEKDNAFKLGKQQLAIGFMNYLDDNRPKSKMISNGEYVDIDKAFKENNWKKIMGYADKYLPYVPSWKPSEEQMEVDLNAEIEKELRLHYNDDQDVYWWNYLKNSFRHFYELGLNTRK